jgi:magnesium chelatase subunit D
VRAWFPFSAVVGQHDLRLALLLNAVHPTIGGVLVRGEKGTAKSTVVRALAGLLPRLAVVDGCRFGCDPAAPDPDCPDAQRHAPGSRLRDPRLVELPVGASEDRVIGSLDLQRALSEGVSAYQPGLLAAAHRGVLYVDEVNLLADHLVDLLLDAAAMGRAHVEREGVSASHAAEFLLVGTMNPEEGELRPQLLDRFGLTVTVAAERDVAARGEVVRRRLAFEADPEGFAALWHGADEELAARIVAARAALPAVQLPEVELRRIAAVCAEFDVDGMRADLVLARTAVAHAAWRGGAEVTADDVELGARLVLPHRRRRDPFDEPGLEDEQLHQAMQNAAQQAQSEQEPDGPDDDPSGPGGGAAPPARDGDESGSGDSPEEQRAGGESRGVTPDPAFRARLLEIPGVGAGSPGRRSRARSGEGRVVRPSQRAGTGLHLPATIAAAAPHQYARGAAGRAGLALQREDLRRTVREGKEANLVLFVVDASGSMAARARMNAVTGAVVSLLADAYQRRDKVAVVTFRGRDATLALPPTSSVETAVARLSGMRTGGRTPLAAGLLRARKTLATERIRDPARRALLVVLTDGKATAGVGGDDPMRDAHRAAADLAGERGASVVVDCEAGPVRLGLASDIAARLQATCLPLAELSAESVASVVRAGRAA